MPNSNQRFFVPASKGISQSLFLVFFAGLILLAGYLYFFNQKSPTPQTASTASGLSEGRAGLIFTHPSYGYSLTLPFWWRDRYEIREGKNRTDFYYLPAQTGLPAPADRLTPVFSVLVLNHDYNDLNSQKIGELTGKSFWLEISKDGGKLKGIDQTDWQKMISEIPAISRSFRSMTSNQDLLLKKFLMEQLDLKGTSTLSVLAYETLATEEGASSTKAYIWLAVTQYAWRDNFLMQTKDISAPLVVLWQKNGQAGYEPRQVIRPRAGRYYQTDLKKIFPQSIIQNPIFLDRTPEHDQLRQKLANDLATKVLAYFGSSPILTRYGWIKRFGVDNGNLVVTINEVEVEQLSPNATTTSASRITKCSATLTICQLNGYLVKNYDQSSYRYVVATSTAISVRSATSTDRNAQVEVPLSDFAQAFIATSTLRWKNQVYQLSLVDDRVVNIEPL